MISSKRTKTAAALGLVLVVATVMLFMQFFPRQEGRHWVCLLFILLGEFLPLAGFIWLEDTPGSGPGPGLRLGIYTLFFLYGAAAASLALILLAVGVRAVIMATWEIVLLLGFGAILFLAAGAGGGEAKNGARERPSVVFMRGLEQEIGLLAAEPANRPFAPQLRQIYEGVRYSDYSGLSSVDEGLREKIRELQFVLRDEDKDGDEAGVRPTPHCAKQVQLLTEDILRLLRSRGSEMKQRKGGARR